jgi:hypothetical protein
MVCSPLELKQWCCCHYEPCSPAEANANDRVTVEWTNTPEGAAGKQFQREWFQEDGMVRRNNLPIEYNM